MNKKIALILICILTICSLAGCGANKKAQNAYENLNTASEITYNWSNDIYQIWLLSAKSRSVSVDSLCSNIHGISKDELIEGLIEYIHSHATDWTDDLEDKIKADPDSYITAAATAFSCQKFDVCIEAVVCAYDKNGKSDQVQKCLDDAKEAIKKCNEKKDYYSVLKDYYSTVNSYYDFCKTPQGNLDQVETTINDYNNKVRDYKNSLDLELDK